MKKLILLGILLLAGLSFAYTLAPPNWMEYSVNRYVCNYAYNEYGYINGTYVVGLMGIAETYDNCSDPEYWGCDAMNTSTGDMEYAMNGESGWDICEYAGCYGSERMSVTGFRSSMLGYNVAAASFKSYFLAGLRAYLADDGDREAVLEDLQDARSDSLLCLRDLQEEDLCHVCIPPV